MNRVKVLSLLAGALLPVASFATPLSYNYVELNYVAPEVDVPGVDNGDGWQLNGSVSFAENWYFTGRYAQADLDGVDLDRISAGIGYDTKIAEATSLYGQVTYESFDFDFPNGDDSGWGAEVGLRYALTPQFEINGGVEYIDVLDVPGLSISSAGVRLGAFYDFTPNFAVVAGYENVDDYDQWSLGGRWTFAP